MSRLVHQESSRLIRTAVRHTEKGESNSHGCAIVLAFYVSAFLPNTCLSGFASPSGKSNFDVLGPYPYCCLHRCRFRPC